MGGLIRAEWLRLRKRAPLVIILLAVPILVGFSFFAGSLSLQDLPPFDAAASRADMIANGFVEALPPDEAEQLLDEYLEQERQSYEMTNETIAVARAGYVFPRSLITVLGNGFMVFFALVLLTAITIGDDFSSGTIRTTLLASSHRRRILSVRFLALATVAIFMFSAMLLLGAVLPLFLNVGAGRLPATLPEFDLAAMAALAGGQLLAGFAIIAFAAMATVIVRGGGLTLVAVLLYVVLEGVVLVVASRFESFQSGGKDAWMLTALPVRGLTELISVASGAASGLSSYPGQDVSRDIQPTFLPIASFVALAFVFGFLAYRRFQRMDIVE